MGHDSVARTHVGCKRTNNEDAVLARGDLGLWVVADGMGRHASGEVASGMIVERLAGLDPKLDLAAKAASVRAILTQVNATLFAMGEGEGPNRTTIGSTVVVVVAQGDRFACLWAGDSRVYRLSDDRLVQITRDHSLVQDLVDAGEIDPADARTHPNANVVMRAVGARPEIVIDQVDGALPPGDMLLLASDGLGRVVEDEELAAEMAAPSVTAAADRLIEMTLERGAPDNVSVVIVRAGR